MFNFDNAKTKELEKLFSDKDIIGLEAFFEKNSHYKKIYAAFKGRFYFNTKDNFSFRVSPDQQTAALACMLYNNHSQPSLAGYNLEILITRADTFGNFHKCEHIRFDNTDKVNFIGLENNAVLLQHSDNPKQILRYGLPEITRQPLLQNSKFSEFSSTENKKETLLKVKAEYRQRQQKYPPNALQAKLAVWNEINSQIKL